MPHILETDASDECIAAALMQRLENKDCPIAFYNRSINNAERNYDTSQKEPLAVYVRKNTQIADLVYN